MGNEQSSQKGAHFRSSDKDKDKQGHVASRDATPPQPAPVPDAAPIDPAPSTETSPLAPSPTAPVDVPSTLAASSSPPLSSAIPSSLDPASASDYLPPASQFSRPPRLPLPIEEEVHTPGSPIISPQEIWTPVHESDADGMLPRRSSMLSTTTADDEDLGEEFKGPGQGRPTVPTLIEWEGSGERVYVTGTFAGWNRKYKLHRNGPSKKKDALSAYVSVTPGTHHLTFLVDNDMRTSDKLPTAVDYTNILVNYIEVPYPELTPLPASPPAKDAAAATDPLDAATPVQEREAPAG
ncbi:hypothetical protein J4E85_010924, partial [Alternaria conjuncta]|uniref:uncharacterized protein n=1 Tax=Alternaria conjuncta TaxID=181017 RepID=UPI0022208218